MVCDITFIRLQSPHHIFPKAETRRSGLFVTTAYNVQDITRDAIELVEQKTGYPVRVVALGFAVPPVGLI